MNRNMLIRLTATAAVALSLGAAGDARATPPASDAVSAVEQHVALGNAHSAAGDHGRAILALERARVFAPRDAIVAASLQRARENAGVMPAPESRFAWAVGALSSDEWTWLALAGLGCTGLSIVLVAWSTRRRRIGWVAAAIGLSLGLASASFALRVAPTWSDAIIVANEQVRIAPFDAAQAVFSARAGEHARIEQHHGDHVYIRIDEQRAGWVPARAVEPLLPTERRPSGD